MELRSPIRRPEIGIWYWMMRANWQSAVTTYLKTAGRDVNTDSRGVKEGMLNRYNALTSVPFTNPNGVSANP